MDKFLHSLTVEQLEHLHSLVGDELNGRQQRLRVRIYGLDLQGSRDYRVVRQTVIAALKGVRSTSVRIDVQRQTATIDFDTQEELDAGLERLKETYQADRIRTL